jgi:dCTP deaminase
MQEGLLPSQHILDLIRKKHISIANPEGKVQPNSMDLPLGSRCWRLRGMRTPRPNETIEQVIKELAIDELDLHTPRILERNAVYLVELAVQCQLPAHVKGDCDSKSSTGRLDIHTRLVVDGVQQYDKIPYGYKGKLYLFVSSNSFLIRVQEGLSFNQVRFSIGNPVIPDHEAIELVKKEKLLYVNNKPVTTIEAQQGVIMHLDLKQPIVGYRAKFTNAVVDLTRMDNPADDFWETIHGPLDAITLERNQFYILSTLEFIRIPHTHTGWIPPFRPEFGEFRSHYAGFYDSGFGYGNGELTGNTTTLEVRSHDNSLTLLHGTPISPVIFLKVIEKPNIIYDVQVKSNYGGQRGPKLAKYFKQGEPISFV